MLGKLGPLRDLTPTQFLLFGGRSQSRVGRRHSRIGIVAEDSGDEQAFIRPSRQDDVFQQPFSRIESQLGLTGFGVRSVTAEALIGKDRPDVLLEGNRFVFRAGSAVKPR
jgi:hypothetical protein